MVNSWFFVSYHVLTVISIAQDQQGFLWFGTWGGLHKYDGYRVTTYTHDPEDPASLSFDWVEYVYTKIGPTRSGWARTVEGSGLEPARRG